MKLIKTLGLLLGAALAVQAPVQAQNFPNKPINLMVPYPAGGLSDIIARKINVPLGTELKQPVIIENLGGAGGAIAAQKVLNAPADGYYLFQGSPNELILAPLAMKAVKHTPDDFRLIQRMAMAPMAIVASKNFPGNTPQEMVAEIVKRAKAGKPVNYASVGTGSFYHLLGEEMAKKIGAEMLHVPYKGGGPILQDLLGGQMGFESELGKGSRFWLRLPVVATAAPVAKTASTRLEVKTADKAWRFLVVDDHPLNRLLVRQVLLNAWPSCQVLEAVDGQKALEVLAAQAVDLVLMDMVMPVMDGIAATAAIRQNASERLQDLPILGLTANVTPQDLERFESAGLSDLMLKPFEPAQLCDKVEALLRQSAVLTPVI